MLQILMHLAYPPAHRSRRPRSQCSLGNLTLFYWILRDRANRITTVMIKTDGWETRMRSENKRMGQKRGNNREGRGVEKEVRQK